MPDFEPIVYLMLGILPDRLLMHSLVGALTIDVALTIVILRLLAYIKLEKIGLHGFSNPHVTSRSVILSAAIGSLSHVLVDSLHHEYNPLLWLIGPTYFTGPLVLVLGHPQATYTMAIIALVIIFIVIKKILNSNGHGLLLIFSNPVKALSVLTSTLDK